MQRVFACSALAVWLAVSSVRGLELHKLVKREQAFDLLRLERVLDDARHHDDGLAAASRRSRNLDPTNTESCQEACNEELRTGLDMIKAHTAFGSIGVPSVVDGVDIELFCRYDAAHDSCLRRCGYDIQYNMREYVCGRRRSELVANLACYNTASHRLKESCGGRLCGPYTELDVSQSGIGTRCRSLICDLTCTHAVLVNDCGWWAGKRAFRFLLDYTRNQVVAWVKGLAAELNKPVRETLPRSCRRLFCERFDASNCTYVPTT